MVPGGSDSGTVLIINKLLKTIDAHTCEKAEYAVLEYATNTRGFPGLNLQQVSMPLNGAARIGAVRDRSHARSSSFRVSRSVSTSSRLIAQRMPFGRTVIHQILRCVVSNRRMRNHGKPSRRGAGRLPLEVSPALSQPPALAHGRNSVFAPVPGSRDPNPSWHQGYITSVLLKSQPAGSFRFQGLASLEVMAHHCDWSLSRTCQNAAYAVLESLSTRGSETNNSTISTLAAEYLALDLPDEQPKPSQHNPNGN